MVAVAAAGGGGVDVGQARGEGLFEMAAATASNQQQWTPEENMVMDFEVKQEPGWMDTGDEAGGGGDDPSYRVRLPLPATEEKSLLRSMLNSVEGPAAGPSEGADPALMAPPGSGLSITLVSQNRDEGSERQNRDEGSERQSRDEGSERQNSVEGREEQKRSSLEEMLADVGSLHDEAGAAGVSGVAADLTLAGHETEFTGAANATGANSVAPEDAEVGADAIEAGVGAPDEDGSARDGK